MLETQKKNRIYLEKKRFSIFITSEAKYRTTEKLKTSENI